MELDLTPDECDLVKSLERETLRWVDAALFENRLMPAYPTSFVRQFHERVDIEIAGRQGALGDIFKCRKGCSRCCRLSVDVPLFELFYIATQVAKWPSDDLLSLLQRLRQYKRIASGEQRETHDTACPFLVNDLCTIYPIRPFVCRKLYSLDIQTCIERQPMEETLLYARTAAILVGAVQAYEAQGFRRRDYSMAIGVLKALDDSALEKHWLNGEDVLKANELPDSSSCLGQQTQV